MRGRVPSFRMYSKLKRLLDAAAGVLVTAGAILVGLMALHVVLDVGGRYLFNFPLPGTVEIVTYYYMVGAIFGPLAFVQSHRGHYVAEVFTRRMSRRAAAALDALCLLVTALLLAFLTWRTCAYAWSHTEAREHVQTAYFTIPTWPARWFVPAGLGLMSLYALAQALDWLVGGPPPKD